MVLGINVDLLRRLEKKEFPWERMCDLNPNELGELVRNPKVGKHIHQLVHQLPKLDLQCHVQPITRSLVKMELSITPDFSYTSLHNPGALTRVVILILFAFDCV